MVLDELLDCFGTFELIRHPLHVLINNLILNFLTIEIDN